MEPELPEDYYEPSPGPWAFETHRYGLANVLLDRDGRVLGTHLRFGDGHLMAEAPAMVTLLCELAAGAKPEKLRERADSILRLIDDGHSREPGEDDDQRGRAHAWRE